MATTTISTVQALLKEFYIGVVIDLLNLKAIFHAHIKGRAIEFEGKVAIVTLHVGGASIANGSETSALPTAGVQTDIQMKVQPKITRGTFEVSFQLMRRLRKQGKYAFLSWAESTMKRLRNDFILFSNRQFITGGEVKGFLRERKQGLVAPALQLVGNPASFSAADSWIFDGDFQWIVDAGIVAGTPDTWVRLDLIRQDTKARGVVTTLTQANINLMCAGGDRAAGTIDLRLGTDDGAGGDQLDTRDGVAGKGFEGIGDYSIAVVPHATQATDSAPALFGGWKDELDHAAAAAAGTRPIDIAEQVDGVLSNLAMDNLFEVDRTTATGYTVTQALCKVAGGAGNARTAVTRTDLDVFNADIYNLVADKPTILWMNALQEQMYKALLIGTVGYVVSGERATHGDAGFSSISHDGVPIKNSQHMPNGMIYFEDVTTWSMAELTPAQFDDTEGHILHRKSGYPLFEGYIVEETNLFCSNPRKNGVLSGFTL